MLKLPPLKCAGILCKPGVDYHQSKPIQTFHFTCLHCRKRRWFYRRYTYPPYFIEYTYLSWWGKNKVKTITVNGVKYVAPQGKWLIHSIDRTLHIDPRGRFVMLRCAVVVAVDRLMVRFGRKFRDSAGRMIGCEMRKPWVELCELMSNYPT